LNIEVASSLSDPDVRVGVLFIDLCPLEFSICQYSPTCEVICMLFILLDVGLVGFTTILLLSGFCYVGNKEFWTVPGLIPFELQLLK
jgi:hypothetical protein